VPSSATPEGVNESPLPIPNQTASPAYAKFRISANAPADFVPNVRTFVAPLTPPRMPYAKKSSALTSYETRTAALSPGAGLGDPTAKGFTSSSNVNSFAPSARVQPGSAKNGSSCQVTMSVLSFKNGPEISVA
jgi:hypothetical protein